MTTAAILLADGFEEIEAITPIDVLRRSGITVTVLGVGERTVRGSHDILIGADTVLPEAQARTFDALLLPGGMPGAKNLRDSALVQEFIQKHQRAGSLLGAICAGPIALAKAGVLDGRRATCFPGFEDEVQKGGARVEVAEDVVIDGNVITSRGPATAMRFALALAERLAGDKKARHVGMSMLATS